MLKDLIKKFIPAVALAAYHRFLSRLAAVWYRNPSEELVVIGVTGTNGKSSTVNLIARMLEHAGYKVGLTSTAVFKIADEETLNPLKMTMPGRFFLQRTLRRMVDAGCAFAVIESSSEGILQHRHRDIHYDTMVFTRLAPEHLERHGGLERYKQAKLEYFRHLERLPGKIIGGRQIAKAAVVNLDDECAGEFLACAVDTKIGFTLDASKPAPPGTAVVAATSVAASPQGTSFDALGEHFSSKLKGVFNVRNALAALAVAHHHGAPLAACAAALAGLDHVPGRMELIEAGQNFTVVVDYAPEPNSLAALYEAIGDWPKGQLIHVLGSTGGGRDRSRRKTLGAMAGRTADVVIVTNEDPYDDDPLEIIKEVSAGVLETGKILERNLFEILDRREAIRKAFGLASPGDLVLLTGKGAEQAIVVSGNKKIPWDERVVAREELARLAPNS